MSSTKFDPAAFDAAVAGPNGWDGVSDPVAEVRKMRGDEETLDDIEREMRTYFQMQKRNGNPEHRTWHQVLSDWADRIEEAAKRMEVELREDEAKMLLREYAAAPDESLTPSALALKRELLALAPQDDNAKLREALCDIVMLTMKVGLSIRGDVACGIIANKAKRALAAPPRNCDRFANSRDAIVAFENKIDYLKEGGADYGDLAAWLFSKAEGKEAFNG